MITKTIRTYDIEKDLEETPCDYNMQCPVCRDFINIKVDNMEFSGSECSCGLRWSVDVTVEAVGTPIHGFKDGSGPDEK